MPIVVIPAKAGSSDRKVAACLRETPGFGAPTKYYFVGSPCAGVTV
jgi:hypothetical protein